MRAAWLALVLGIAVATSGCPGPQTRIEQGQAPTTGIAEYDAFFKEVVELHAQAKQGDDQAGAARKPLAKALGVDDKDGMKTIAAASERAKKLREDGLKLHLQLTPEPKLVRVAAKGTVDPETEAWLKAVEESAKASLDVSLKLGALPDRLSELEKKREELRAQTQKSFDKPETRREVDREMDAAKQIIEQALLSSARGAGDASRFLLELARAVETGGADALAEASKGPATPPPKPAVKWKGPARPAGAGGGIAPAAPPPAAPPKRPPSGDDFDP